MSINQLGEVWKDVPGYEGLYMVSSYGNVISVAGGNGRQPFKPLRMNKNNAGYYQVSLVKDSKAANVQIHRIVAIAFIPNPEHKEQVNHNDGNKLNNSVDNLEWVTRSENALHCYRVLGFKRQGKERPVKINSEIAKEIYQSTESVKNLANKFEISETMVRNIKSRKSWRNATCQLTT